MSFINFESARAKENARNDLRDAREELLRKVQLFSLETKQIKIFQFFRLNKNQNREMKEINKLSFVVMIHGCFHRFQRKSIK